MPQKNICFYLYKECEDCQGNPTKVIHKDTSLDGRGASHGSPATGDAWLFDEKTMHKNASELKEFFLAF